MHFSLPPVRSTDAQNLWHENSENRTLQRFQKPPLKSSFCSEGASLLYPSTSHKERIREASLGYKFNKLQTKEAKRTTFSCKMSHIVNTNKLAVKKLVNSSLLRFETTIGKARLCAPEKGGFEGVGSWVVVLGSDPPLPFPRRRWDPFPLIP